MHPFEPLSIGLAREKITRCMIGAALALSSCQRGPVQSTTPRRAVAAQATDTARVAPRPQASSSAKTLGDSENVAPSSAVPETPPTHFPFNDPLPDASAARKAAATHYGNFFSAQCRAEIKKRKIEVKPGYGPARGISTPLRLAGPLHGVRFVTPGAKSVYGMLDCRLVLALDDLAAVLERNDVVQVQVDNLYRPHAHLPGKKRKPSQHAYGLAIDLVALTLRDGRTLVVERDWHGAIGAPPCGPDATVPDTADETIRLRNLLCEVAREGLFHHLLTPNYDLAHSNHWHLDIKRDEHTIVVR